jgi:hypothetical protein
MDPPAYPPEVYDLLAWLEAHPGGRWEDIPAPLREVGWDYVKRDELRDPTGTWTTTPGLSGFGKVVLREHRRRLAAGAPPVGPGTGEQAGGPTADRIPANGPPPAEFTPGGHHPDPLPGAVETFTTSVDRFAEWRRAAAVYEAALAAPDRTGGTPRMAPHQVRQLLDAQNAADERRREVVRAGTALVPVLAARGERDLAAAVQAVADAAAGGSPTYVWENRRAVNARLRVFVAALAAAPAAPAEPPGPAAGPAGHPSLALLRVFTNGLSDERIREAARVLSDGRLTAHDKLTEIDALLPFPPTASAEQLGDMLGVTKQAVMKTGWWKENRKGEKADEVGRRRAAHRKRAQEHEPPGPDADGER